MKRSVVIALVVLGVYAFSIISPWTQIAYYTLNQEKITQLFCQNKDKPKLQCNGKCYLKYQLEENSENNTESAVTIIWTGINGILTNPPNEVKLFWVSKNKVDVYYLGFLTHRYIPEKFVPPQGLVFV